MTRLDELRALVAELRSARDLAAPDSVEDRILEEMEDVWWQMSDEERAIADREAREHNDAALPPRARTAGEG